MYIKQLENLVAAHIGSNKKYIDTNVTNLVAPGENYGGELLKLDITVQDTESEKLEVVHVVGKLIHSDEKLQEAFSIQTTFRSEIIFYKKIIPALQSLQREYNVEPPDCFAKFYGGRLNLTGNDNVDRDGVIILENLIASGYNNLDRHVGYSLEEAKVLLKDLAIFQATCIALKIKKPDYFAKEIRPHCTNSMTVIENDPFDRAILLIDDILRESDSFVDKIPLVNKYWNEIWIHKYKYEPREPFATISHNDLWVNNAMLKYENGKPVKNKFVDFQMYNYGGPGIDILNFLFTSVRTQDLKENFEDLLKLIHLEFVYTLSSLDCDTTPFSYSNFLKDLALDAPKAFTWAVMFIPFIVFGRKGVSLPQDIQFENVEVRQDLLKSIPQAAKDRLFFMIEELQRRSWI